MTWLIVSRWVKLPIQNPAKHRGINQIIPIIESLKALKNISEVMIRSFKNNICWDISQKFTVNLRTTENLMAKQFFMIEMKKLLRLDYFQSRQFRKKRFSFKAKPTSAMSVSNVTFFNLSWRD